MTPVSMPTQLGRYKLLRQLGQGGMGAVWVAFDTELQREVAIKFPLVNAENNPTAVERFVREARLAAKIDHPNFCPVHDVGKDQGFPFYVMPIIPGRPLSDYVRRGDPWPLERAAHLIAALASALAQLHQRGIIHRDLKPANVMVKPDGNIVLMDFGLARSFEGTSEGLTATGAIMGTVSYMAPEQAAGDDSPVGPAADVWALGVMLYQLIAGRLPFIGTNREVLARVLTQNPLPPSQHRPDRDTRLDAISALPLHKEPAYRPVSMAALAATLSGFLGGQSTLGNRTTLQSQPEMSDTLPKHGQGKALIDASTASTAFFEAYPLPPIEPLRRSLGPIQLLLLAVPVVLIVIMIVLLLRAMLFFD